MTFQNLPLTPEQDAEIQRYIIYRKERSLPWDTLELDYMLKEMLRENEERAIGVQVPRVLALLAVERQAHNELDAGRQIASVTLRNLAENAGLDRFASLNDMADEAARIKDELIAQHKPKKHPNLNDVLVQRLLGKNTGPDSR